MKKKLTLLILLVFSLVLATSCGSKQNNSNNTGYEAFNNWCEVRMENGALYKKNDNAYLIDYETMESSILCNIPNCSHSSSDCIVYALKKNHQLPIIYNRCAYYFENSFSYKEEDGKNKLDLKSKVKKYDFNNNKITNIAEIDGFNFNTNGGSYLIGSNYYFTTNYGNPDYDEAGNVIGSNSGGGGNLLCINLENGKVTDYGEIFDYDKIKERYPASRSSTSMCLRGKIDNELYIGVYYGKEEVTPEIFENSEFTPSFSGETYVFNMDTHQIKKLDDKFSTCSMNGYHTYFTDDKNTKLEIEDVKTGEIYDGPEIQAYNALSIIDDKVWHDSKCFDIKSGSEKEISSLSTAYAIDEYKDYYIIEGLNSENQVEFEKLSKSVVEN